VTESMGMVRRGKGTEGKVEEKGGKYSYNNYMTAFVNNKL